MLVEIGLIVLLVVLNGVFSGTELALVSAKRGRLQQRAELGDRRAVAALHLQDDPNRLLSTVQFGISLIGTLAGAFGGASLARRLSALLAGIPALAPHADSLSLTLVVALITYLSLVLGELVPKRLALQSAEAIATLMARPMIMLATLSRPIIAILTWSTEGLLTLLGRRDSGGPSLTEDDIRQMLREGTETGLVKPHEHDLIESVFAFSTRITRRIMTPRNQIVGFDASATINNIVDAAVANGFSRFPIFEQRPDQISGVVHVRDLLRAIRAGQHAASVSTLMRPVLNVPETVQVADLMSTFRRTHNHMAVVIDEHGSVEGIVTLEDVLEELVGEIDDEHDVGVEPLFAERPDGSLLIDGSAPIDRVAERLALSVLPTYADDHYDTLAGMLLSLFGSIPRKGDSMLYENWRFEIVDMDGLRIDQVLVTPHVPPPIAGDD